MKQIGKELQKRLKIKGVSQKELAEQLFVTQQAVSKWINDECYPSSDNIHLISKILDFDFYKFIYRSEKGSELKMKKESKNLLLLNNYEKAIAETEILMQEANTKDNYSHSINVLLGWLIPATIGLTYYNYTKAKDITYTDIFYYLESYFNIDGEINRKKLYNNDLEHEFFLMGADLFEYNHEDINYKYFNKALNNWYNFSNTIIEDSTSNIYNELRVALMEIININY